MVEQSTGLLEGFMAQREGNSKDIGAGTHGTFHSGSTTRSRFTATLLILYSGTDGREQRGSWPNDGRRDRHQTEHGTTTRASSKL